MIANPTNIAVNILIRHVLEPGDLGWIVQRHGELYAQEYDWSIEFEALAARVVSSFIDTFDPERERCWIAEQEGQRVGSIMLVRESATVGKLRVLLVDPAARGSGLGTRLVEACLAFARTAGYTSVTLWTIDILDAARRIYERTGFQLASSAPFQGFGHDLVQQSWEIDF